MDVRAKQRLSYQTCPLNSELRGGGFAPRHLKRYVRVIFAGRKVSGFGREGWACGAHSLLRDVVRR